MPILLSSLASLAAVWWIYFKILRIAKAKNLVDNPDARKLQRTPVPVMGGIAVFFGIVAGTLTGTVLMPQAITPAGLLLPGIAATAMLYIGAMDDIIGLSPRSRFFIEITVFLALVAATGRCLDSFHGLWGIGTLPTWIAVALTVVAGVGIVNAVNMIDGVNGLSSGLCIVCSALFGSALLRNGDTAGSLLAFSTSAALVPFFMHNVFGKRSRMFIGDAGTMVMGMLMAWFVISLVHTDGEGTETGHEEGPNMVAFSLAVLSVPVFDTLRVMGMRMLEGKNPFSPDKTHLHHVFICVGVSHSVTALCEIGIDAAIVAVWATAAGLGADADLQFYAVTGASAMLVWGMYLLIRHHIVRHTPFLHRLTRFSISTHLGHRAWWLSMQRWLDAPERGEDDEDERILQAQRQRHFPQADPQTEKERDRRRIREFIRGKAEVFIDDIMERSGAERLRVYPIIYEEERAGRLAVVERDGWGAPLIVTAEA